jgi:FkbM family methyltransferase
MLQIIDTENPSSDSSWDQNRTLFFCSMMTSTLNENFAAAVGTYQPTRLSRLLHSPIHLLHSKFLELYAKQFNVPVWRRATTFWGDEMQVVFPEPVSMALYRYKFFERGLTQIMLKLLEPGMVFFDVGSHFGYYSLLASMLVGESGAVHAFEPTPSTFEVLQRNTAGKPNVRVNNLALWSRTESLEFRDYGTTYSAFNSIQAGGIEDKMREGVPGVRCTVQATSVDEYVRATGATPNLLKLDAEGAELNILAGMAETIRRARPILTVEVGDDLEPNGSRSRQLLEAVISHGYRPFEARNGVIVPHELLPRYRYENILLVPAQLS